MAAKLMSPSTLASDGDGNLYIGDHNFIRKLDVNGNVTNLYSKVVDRVEKVNKPASCASGGSGSGKAY